MSAALRESYLYRKLARIERDVRDLKLLLLKRRAEQKACSRPVSLAGLWAGAEISESDLEAAKRSLFPLASQNADA